MYTCTVNMKTARYKEEGSITRCNLPRNNNKKGIGKMESYPDTISTPLVGLNKYFIRILRDID